jgi:protein-S-isoprenylcysteine O-methyltransferase Ste14
MHLLDQRTLGIAILVLLGALVIVKQMATGSILEKPKGDLLAWLTNAFNLFFLLVVNPAAAVLLITRQWEAADPTHLTVGALWPVMGLEIGGAALYAVGFILMAWALVRLGGNYQLGGSSPRDADEMVVAGPYRLVRHPMYAAALSIALGLACLVQSLAFFAVFCIYLVLIARLIPAEEEKLRRAYGERYLAYRQKVSSLVPYLY